MVIIFFFFSSRRRHTRCSRDWSSDVCSSDLREDRVDAQFRHADEDEAGEGGRGHPESDVVVEASDGAVQRSEEHTSELQSRLHLVCRLLLEKKKKNKTYTRYADESMCAVSVG